MTPAVMINDLPRLRVDGRLDRARERLAAVGADAAAVVDLANVRWLTGFTGSNGTVVFDTDTAVLITDGRYAEQAPAQVEAAGCAEQVEVIVARKIAATAAERFGSVDALGLEDGVTWRDQRRWAEAFEPAGTTVVPLEELIEELRAVKDDAELARMRTAAAIADAALAETVPLLRPGTTEVQFQHAIDDAMRARGATGPAYDTIVAAGPNSALPHAYPTDRPMARGDLIIIDVGAEFDGYRSDMTRTFVLGEPDEQAASMIELVTRSQAAGVASVKAGITAGDLDKTCRLVIEDAGMGEAFMHSTGHGVGLHIHEQPRVSSESEEVLHAGCVVTVEPGVYFGGFGGVRVEDLVLVTDDGCRPLTLHPKEPLIRL